MTLTAESLMQMLREIPKAPPVVGRVLCNERMMADARTIAPSPEDAFQGLPISVSSAMPDGYLVLLDRRGEVMGIVGPSKEAKQ
jgi:hypothetical protein